MKNDSDEQFIGSIKYKGRLVDDGVLDARKAAEALLGFDEIMRYFLSKEDPALINARYEIPVLIRKGSWEAIIPELIDKLFTLKGVGYTVLTTYATFTAQKAAQDGLFETGPAKDIKKIFRAALIAAQWALKIGNHLGSFKAPIENLSINSNQNEIIIQNKQGKKLKVPKRFFDQYVTCPEKLFAKNASIVEKDRVLEFSVYSNGKEEKVSITEKEKSIYYTEEEEEILFPELIHGQQVELEGRITRGNEKTNTIGFEYKNHILTCLPKNGNIASYKGAIISNVEGHFFPKVKILGTIDRISKEASIKEKRPYIIFSEIVQLEKEPANIKLF